MQRAPSGFWTLVPVSITYNDNRCFTSAFWAWMYAHMGVRRVKESEGCNPSVSLILAAFWSFPFYFGIRRIYTLINFTYTHTFSLILSIHPSLLLSLTIYIYIYIVFSYRFIYPTLVYISLNIWAYLCAWLYLRSSLSLFFSLCLCLSLFLCVCVCVCVCVSVCAHQFVYVPISVCMCVCDHQNVRVLFHLPISFPLCQLTSFPSILFLQNLASLHVEIYPPFSVFVHFFLKYSALTWRQTSIYIAGLNNACYKVSVAE